MKIKNQAKVSLFMVLSALIIMPGCGKSSTGTSGGGAIVGIAGISGAVTNLGNGCYQVTYNGAPATMTFSGPIAQFGGSSLTFNLPGNANYGPSGPAYTRTDSAGDVETLYVGTSSAYATVTLSANTIAAIAQYNPTGPSTGEVCGYAGNISVGFGSTFTGIIELANGQGTCNVLYNNFGQEQCIVL